MQQPLALLGKHLCFVLFDQFGLSLYILFTYFISPFISHNTSFMIQVTVIIKQRVLKDKIPFCI